MAEGLNKLGEYLARDIRPFWEAIGSFVSTYALVETNMQRALWRSAGIAPPTAQALFSGTRTDAAMNLIRRIAEAEQWAPERKAITDNVFSQLGEITRLRNDLLHYGATPDELDSWTISNAIVAHTAERLRVTKITLLTLRDAEWDLYKIATHLVVIAHGWLHVPEFNDILADAWRYKPERQSSLGKTPGSLVQSALASRGHLRRDHDSRALRFLRSGRFDGAGLSGPI